MSAPTFEASELGFRPGQWPSEVTIDGATYYRGHVSMDGDGDVRYVVYARPGRPDVKVWND